MHWTHDKDAICGQIAAASASGAKAPLKILLTAKDDSEMLERWIAHHRGIVGLENLIIIDNMSRHADTLDTYARYRSDATIFQIDAHFDRVHHPAEFPELYAALRQSCRYFIVLDTDEFLVLFDGEDRFHRDGRINDFILEHADAGVFPGTEFQSERGFAGKFRILDPLFPLQAGLQWGKPLIPADRALAGVIAHNAQLDPKLYSLPLITNFFVLHLNRLVPGADVMPPADHFEITDDGRLKCDADWKYDVLRNFVRNPARYGAPLFRMYGVRNFTPVLEVVSPARSADDRVRFMFDKAAVIEGDRFHVDGWVICAEHIGAIRISHNGNVIGDAVRNGERPDVRRAFPDYAGVEPGFSLNWRPQARDLGRHEFRAELIAADGSVIAAFTRAYDLY